MAYRTLASHKDSVSGMLGGLNLNSVKNVNRAFERAARRMCIKLDIPEAQIRTNLNLFDNVIDYGIDARIFGTSIVDIRPQGMSRDTNTFVVKQPGEQFDREKLWKDVEVKTSFEYISGNPVLRITSAIPTPGITLETMAATTGWAAGGNGSGLALDQTVYWQPPASLRFNLAANGTNGFIEKTIPQVDLTNYTGVASVFVAVQFPSGFTPTSVGVRVGTDSNNYYDGSNTTGFVFSFQSQLWMLVQINLATATTVGAPTVPNIKYLRVYFNYTSTTQVNNVYVGGVWIGLPTPVTLIQQTNAIFKDTSGNFNQTVTNDNDTLILNEAALTIYELESSIEIAKQQGGTIANNFLASLEQDLNGVRGYRGVLVQHGLLDLYRADNPSQEIRPVGSWYDD